MTQPNLRALVALDLDLKDFSNELWARSLISAIASSGICIDFLSRTPNPGEFEAKIQSLCGAIIPANEYSDVEARDASGVSPRFRARQVISLAKEKSYDFVLTQGLALSRYVAGGKAVQDSLWAICDDSPFEVTKLSPQELKQVEVVARGARLILTGSPALRGMLESTIPSVTSKMRLLPSLDLDIKETPQPSRDERVLFYDVNLGYSSLLSLDFSLLVKEATQEQTPPRIVLTGVDDPRDPALLNVLNTTALRSYPGLQLSSESILNSPFLSNRSIILLPTQSSGLTSDFFAQISQQAGISTWWPEKSQVSFGSLPSGIRAKAKNKPKNTRIAWSDYFANDLADYRSVPQRSRKVRVLLAGADFKFAGDLVDALIQRSDIELRVDLFKANAKPQPEKSKKLLPWADVIIAEFASYNAIWYSQNVLPHQKLIVHLHGYELLQPWIDELSINNCAKVVFASNFYKDKAVRLKGWPEDRLHVVPNSVNSADLDRPKSNEARFHIGLVGIVPILKRPDRAISLLERLIDSDPRYVLHIKGHRPWDYAWEWKKAAHQDSYRAFFESIASNPKVFQRIVFEPFSPDIGNWLQKIGWLLSPSYRETFHLSAIEGAASGAVPLAWMREGSMEIIGEDYNFSSTEAVADFIISSNASESTFKVASDAAKKSVERYDIPHVRAQWLELIFTLAQDSQSQKSIHSLELSPVEARVAGAVKKASLADDYEACLAILDDNIPVTRSSASELKDIEMFVRGLLGIDESRLSRFLPEPTDATSYTSHYQYHLVRPSGESSRGLTLSRLDRSETFLDLPHFFQERADQNIAKLGEIDLASPTLTSSRKIRFDRAIHLAKASVIQDVVENKRDYVVAAGPWWVALPALLAADQLGIPSAWIIDDVSVWKALRDVRLQQHSNNYIAHTIHSLFNRVDVRVVESSALPPQAQLADIDITVGVQSSQDNSALTNWIDLPNALTQVRLRRLDKGHRALETKISDLRVGVIASNHFLNQLRSVCPRAFAVDSKDPLSCLSPEIDAVIINADAASNTKWRPYMPASTETRSNTLVKLLDKCRVFGIQSIYLDTKSEAIAPNIVEMLRKVDHLGLALPQSATPLLELHPIAVRTVTPWLTSQPFTTALATVFRGAGLAVVPHRPEINALPEGTGLEIHDSDDYTPDWKPALESIALFFPATELNEAKRISVSCNLPKQLVSLNPVELNHGEENPTKQLLQASDCISGGYVCVLKDIDELPKAFLESMWLSAAEDVVVRPVFDAPATAQIWVNHVSPDSFTLMLGDLYHSSLNHSRNESVTVVYLPVFTSHSKVEK
ncbi:glycosyltransferase family 4 protein [Corynebacterium hesseae]|uniref:glycosyltransferase family 4 protein n=1 Tax=Corynebacterium hesseae TaxID=2913502 RepID=UPI003833531D